MNHLRATPPTRSVAARRLGALATCLLLGLAPVTRAQQDDGAPAPPPALDPRALGRAEKLLDDGSFEKAREELQAQVDLGVDDARLHEALGRALSALGEHAAAVDELLAAVRTRGDVYETRLALADALAAKAAYDAWAGDYEAAGYGYLDARNQYEKAAGLQPGVAEPWLRAARAERDRGDRDAAIDLLERGLQEQPDHVASQLELGSQLFGRIYALQQQGDLTGLERTRARIQEVYAHVLELDEDNGYAINGQAWLALERGDEEAAIARFAESLEKDPTLDDSYRNLRGLLGDSREEREELVSILDRVVSASGRRGSGDERKRMKATARYQRGVVKKALRDYADARKDFAEAARASTDFAMAATFQNATIAIREQEQDAAIEALVGAMKTDAPALVAAAQLAPDAASELASVRYLITRSYNMNNLNDARELARLVAEAMAGNAGDWNNLAFFCRETGRYEDAYAAYSNALALTPDDPRLLNDTALILQYHLGRDLEYAAELYQRAVDQAERLVNDEAAADTARADAREAGRDAANNLRMLQEGRHAGAGGKKRRGARDDGGAADERG